MSTLKLSVVIPAYNEAKNLGGGVLNKIYDYFKKQDYPWEVLIVDDGSTDETIKIVESQVKDKPGFRLVKNLHGGKAVTVLSGMLKTVGDIAVFTDMDQATPISQVEKLLPEFKEGFDVVIGSRSGRQGAPLIRKIVALGFMAIRTAILGLPFKDTQCGFKAFNQKSIKVIMPRVLEIWEKKKFTGAAVNAGFDVEVLFIAKKLGFKITEVPVEWHHVGTERVQLVQDSLEAFKDMLRIRLNDLKGKYS